VVPFFFVFFFFFWGGPSIQKLDRRLFCFFVRQGVVTLPPPPFPFIHLVDDCKRLPFPRNITSFPLIYLLPFPRHYLQSGGYLFTKCHIIAPFDYLSRRECAPKAVFPIFLTVFLYHCPPLPLFFCRDRLTPFFCNAFKRKPPFSIPPSLPFLLTQSLIFHTLPPSRGLTPASFCLCA